MILPFSLLEVETNCGYKAVVINIKSLSDKTSKYTFTNLFKNDFGKPFLPPPS